MKGNQIMLVGAVVIIAYLVMNGVGFAGVPSTVTLRVVDTAGKPVSDAICYVNQAGRSDCADPYENATYCQIRDTSDSQGLCDFNGEKVFSSGFNYPVAAVCGIGVKVQSSYNPLPGMPSVKELTCRTYGPGGNNTSEPVVEVPVERPPGVPICIIEAYPDEACGDFNYGQKYYSFLKDSGSKKLCWTSPSWVFGPCMAGETPVGDTCSAVPTYTTRDTCDPGFKVEGEYCVIYSEKTAPTVQCDIDQTLQSVGGVNVCVSQPQPKTTEYLYVDKYAGYLGSENMAILAGVGVAVLGMFLLKKLKMI